jgi:hypothetical protein
MSGHPLYLLAFATFIVVLGFLFYNYISNKASQKTGGRGTSSGLGGPNDPLG